MTVHVDVRSYFVDEWGQPDREASFYRDDFVVGVLKWQASEVTRGVTFYVTVGASNYPLPEVVDSHRQEFLAAFNPEFDDIASSLAWLGIYSQRVGAQMGAGHIYRAPDGLVEGSELAGFMVVDPADDFPVPISLADGRHVEFLLAIPAYGDELDYAAGNGVDALLEKMDELDTPVWDPRRKSVFG